MKQLNTRAFGPLALLLAASAAHGQATERAIFVGNNGNLEGSVTTYSIDANNRPVFKSKTIIGARLSGQPAINGTNAAWISLSPNGKFIAVSHTTALTTEQVTILKVNADATTEVVGGFPTPDSPLSLGWVTNEYLVVTRTQTSGGCHVILYRYDAAANTLTETDREPSGLFNSEVLVDRARKWVYANDTNGATIRHFTIDESTGALTLASSVNTGSYQFGMSMTPNGKYMFHGVGISVGGNSVWGLVVDAVTGALTLSAQGRFLSGGESSGHTAVSTDGSILWVGHNGDGRIFSHIIDDETGFTSPTINVFDIGGQGDTGSLRTIDNLLVVAKKNTIGGGNTGVRIFTYDSEGLLTPTGPDWVPSQGTQPTILALWKPLPAAIVGCQPADIADDQGTALNAPGRDPEVPNSGVNEGDFNAFFGGFFNAAAHCDIADDQGTALPPFGTGGSGGVPNGGVNEGDYNLFFQRFFDGC